MVVKICGVTRAVDAQVAVEAGATALGFNFWPRSPRCVSAAVVRDIVRGVPSGVWTVGVFVDQPVEEMAAVRAEAGLSMVQLHGRERPEVASALGGAVIRAVGIDDVEAEAAIWPVETTWLLDAIDPARRGGTGVLVDWPRAAQAARRRPIILAGGLTPDNVAAAIAAVRPFGVDVSSGVEQAPGIKDPEKVRLFVQRARRAFEEGA